MTIIPVSTTEARRGDIAIHINGSLDSRMVAGVSEGGVWLYMATEEPQGPFPLENYYYRRAVEEGIP